MKIRTEKLVDTAAIAALGEAAFGNPAEARLITALRRSARPLVSLVAEDEEAGPLSSLVGHIMFSPVTLPDHDALRLMGLAPMAVAPPRQRSGIGSLLVKAGLDACRELDTDAIVVLGHPEYYPRFGFLPASRFGIRSVYDAPDEAFMVLELAANALSGASGTVYYHEAFDDL